jgi:hypothetical protein
MATAEDLIARLLKARERELEIEPGVSVTLRRPAASEVGELRLGGIRSFLACVVGWNGVSEELLFGEGSAKSLPFDASLWLTVAADRAEWVNAVIEAVAADIKAYAEASEARRKN